MKKLFVAMLMCAALGAQAEAPAKYQSSCFACHAMGAAGAPKTHDVAAWAPRMEKGMDAMVASVKNGLNGMPPTGLCADCSDAEYVELIQFMAEPAPAQ
ncbi:MAG: cytochrome c5 family protein [Halioglobus sp.]|nr:cytochrome c5 family protein [Halioglobus sp.]